MATAHNSSRRAHGLPWVGLFGLAACTAVNPAFGDGDASDAGTGASTTTASATSDAQPSGTGSDGGSTLSGSTLPSAGSETTADTVDPTSSTGDPADTCRPHEGLVNNILADSSRVVCPGPVVVTDGRITMRGEVLEVASCDGCPTNCAGPEFTIDLDVSVTVPSENFPQCGRLVMWGSPAQPDPCDWLGVALFASDESPLFVVSDSLEAPPAAGGMLATMVDRIPCDGMCPGDRRQPGSYSLSMGAAHVAPGQVGDAVVTIGQDTSNARFENHGAVIGPECKPQASWVLDFTNR